MGGDLFQLTIVEKMTACPILVDVSHAAGRIDILSDLVIAAFAVSAKGTMLKVHPCSPAARSDASQQITPDEFIRLGKGINRIILQNFPT